MKLFFLKPWFVIFFQKFILTKDECVKKCHDKNVIQQVVDLCKDKKDLLCKANHDCEEKKICDCKIKFLCDKVHDKILAFFDYPGFNFYEKAKNQAAKYAKYKISSF